LYVQGKADILTQALTYSRHLPKKKFKKLYLSGWDLTPVSFVTHTAAGPFPIYTEFPIKLSRAPVPNEELILGSM